MILGRRAHERGATALIIVMFSVLLFVTITVGFMKVMSDEQTRTNDNELSQGAYDSALAGVEDGKRVLAACAAGDANACAVVDNPNQKCTTISDAGFAVPQANGEVYLKTSLGANGTDFEQAYTCVKISRSTPDYRNSGLQTDTSAIIPLRAAPGDTFDDIVISWFAPNAANGLKPPLLNNTPSLNLPKFATWSSQTPPILRAQLMQMNASGFKAADLDASGGSNTVYLYPKGIGSINSGFAIDGRRSGSLEPTPVKCSSDFDHNGGYACQVTLSLTNPVGGGAADRVAYLRLTSLYSATAFKIQMKKSSGQIVNFYDVQPSVDSTGRAGDVFRRVDARVERTDPNESLLYPRATVDITGNFCKSFVITDSTADYNAGACTP